MVEYPCVFDWNGRRYMLYNGNDYGGVVWDLPCSTNGWEKESTDSLTQRAPGSQRPHPVARLRPATGSREAPIRKQHLTQPRCLQSGFLSIRLARSASYWLRLLPL